MILPVVLYGCKTSSLSEREENGWSVWERGAKMVEHKWEEVIGERRKLHNEEIYNFSFSPNITGAIKSRSIWWVRHVAYMGEMRKAYKILVGKS
jgi:hypothetical protein